jgi:DNA-binding NarL/FixJ family response regulator
MGAMGTSVVRLLVVDDYEPFRRFVSSMLERRPELQVIGEASDGLEAVQKAEALQPDLILLDVGLPTLNGIEAARQIRKLSPKSRILFLSQETSAHVVQEAFSSGALGYVVKEHAGGELLAAVEAVSQDRKFVSRGLQGHRFNEAAYAGTRDLQHQEDLPSLMAIKGEITRTHEAQFYSDDASFLVGFTHFIESALKSGNAVIVVATEAHRKSIVQRLQTHGVDTAAAIEQGLFIPLDVAETLATVMVNDLPDPVRFMKVTGDLFEAAARAAKGEHPRVAACGEGAPLLWAQGKTDAAIQLEHLWNEVAKTCNVDILCGYVLESLQSEQESHIYERICAEHSAVRSQ